MIGYGIRVKRRTSVVIVRMENNQQRTQNERSGGFSKKPPRESITVYLAWDLYFIAVGRWKSGTARSLNTDNPREVNRRIKLRKRLVRQIT